MREEGGGGREGGVVDGIPDFGEIQVTTELGEIIWVGPLSKHDGSCYNHIVIL